MSDIVSDLGVSLYKTSHFGLFSTKILSEIPRNLSKYFCEIFGLYAVVTFKKSEIKNIQCNNLI